MSLSILMHWVQKFWLWGRFVAEKTNLRFESHGRTSVEHDIWWKQQVKCLGARPLYWQIIFGHPLSGFVLKNGAPKVWKMLILKCPAMRFCPTMMLLSLPYEMWNWYPYSLWYVILTWWWFASIVVKLYWHFPSVFFNMCEISCPDIWERSQK